MRATVALVSAALLMGAAETPRAAEPVTLTGELSASLGAIPVAAGGFEAVVANGRYEVRGHGRMIGLTRLFSDGEARVEARGAMSGAALLPADYRHELKERDDRDRVRIAFAGERVDSVAIEPPPRPRRDRVPLAEEHLRGVLDPLSAIMLLSAGSPGPASCDRTLPIFDGEQRYDIELSFDREERIRGRSGAYSGPAYVCAIRYRPIAGHRPARSAVKYLQRAEGMEIWLAPLGEAVVAPVRARVPTPLGPLVLSATRLSLR